MEEILIIVFQFLFEVVLQILAELPWDLFLSSRGRSIEPSSDESLWITLSFLLGGAVAMASLYLRPNTYLKHSSTRIAYLVFAPVCSAGVSFLLARYNAKRTPSYYSPKLHATCAFCFALVLTVVRFTYAHRPK